MVRQFLAAQGDARTVVADPKAPYFGSAVNDRSLTPDAHPRLGKLHYKEWLESTVPAAQAAH
jgi:hypothetical protein